MAEISSAVTPGICLKSVSSGVAGGGTAAQEKSETTETSTRSNSTTLKYNFNDITDLSL